MKIINDCLILNKEEKDVAVGSVVGDLDFAIHALNNPHTDEKFKSMLKSKLIKSFKFIHEYQFVNHDISEADYKIINRLSDDEIVKYCLSTAKQKKAVE